MIDVSAARTMEPVVVPITASLFPSHYNVFNDEKFTKNVSIRALRISGVIGYATRVVLGATRLSLVCALAVILLAIPGVSGAVAYHVATTNTTVGIIRSQSVPGSAVPPSIVLHLGEQVHPASN